MPCHHCSKARRAAVQAVAAAVKGDASAAIDAVKEAAEHVKAKFDGQKKAP